MPFLIVQHASRATPRPPPNHGERSQSNSGLNAASYSLTAELYQLTATSTALRRHLSVLLDHEAALRPLRRNAPLDAIVLPLPREQGSDIDAEAALLLLLVLQRTMTLMKRIGTTSARLALTLQCSSTQFNTEGDFANAEAAIKRVCIRPPLLFAPMS